MTYHKILHSVFILSLCAIYNACSPGQVVDFELSQRSLIDRITSANAPLILDVRTPEEYRAGHIPGAINIPHTILADRIEELREYNNKEIVVHCESGRRAGLAESVLREAGFNKILHLQGDMSAWRESNLPQAEGSQPDKSPN